VAQVSQLDSVIDGLLAVVTTADLKVLDGNDEPSSRNLERFVVVGGDGDFGGAARPVGATDQQLATFGGSRDERGAVTCAVIAQSGSDKLETARSWSLADLTTLEAALRADETLDGRVANGLIVNLQLFQFRGRQGAVVRRVFTYRYDVLQDLT
jgi:hypothetical protein